MFASLHQNCSCTATIHRAARCAISPHTTRFNAVSQVRVAKSLSSTILQHDTPHHRINTKTQQALSSNTHNATEKLTASFKLPPAPRVCFVYPCNRSRSVPDRWRRGWNVPPVAGRDILFVVWLRRVNVLRLLWFCRWRSWSLERERETRTSGEGKGYKVQKIEFIFTKNCVLVNMTKFTISLLRSRNRTLFETALSISRVFVQSHSESEFRGNSSKK